MDVTGQAEGLTADMGSKPKSSLATDSHHSAILCYYRQLFFSQAINTS